MARVIYTPSGANGPVGAFEREVLETLRLALTRQWVLAPNFQLKPRDRDALEYDLVLLSPHALYVIEAKEWYGRLTGDDQEWLLNQSPKRCPLWTVNHKAKVLKTELGALASQAQVLPVLVVPDNTTIHIGGEWKKSVVNLRNLADWLKDVRRVPAHRQDQDLSPLFPAMEQALQGKWAVRQRQKRRRIGSYEIIEPLEIGPDESAYVARNAFIENDTARYRVRTWRVNPLSSPAEVQQREAVVRRPTEAVAKLGPHPNLLAVRYFGKSEDDHEFVEVTDWSEYGTLHGFLTNTERDKLTIRERLEIAEGVAAALEAVHAAGIVHRNVSPATVLIGFDRRPRLTDFDRAWIPSGQTVFPDTVARAKSAYIPPELSAVPGYSFSPASDMYSFGVLLYQLLTDEVPFDGPDAAKLAAGCPRKLPSDLRAGVDADLDALVLDLLRTDDSSKRPPAPDALQRIRRRLGVTSGPVQRAANGSARQKPPELAVGAVLDGKWRVDEEIGSGTFARVFRVFNLNHQRTYAMKVLVDTENADLAQHEFNEVQPLLPTHPNIVRIVWMDRLGAPLGYPYIVSEFINGETLAPYCADERRLAWRDVQSIGLKLLDALGVLHENGLYHRDIKPANIMLELPVHEPKLIDFNIAAEASKAKGRAGTRRYWAPDIASAGWGPHCDLFSLGVVLYELVTHRHPFPDDRPEAGEPYDPRDIMAGLRLSQDLAEFLLKAVRPQASDRFQSAPEMRAALAAVSSMLAPAATSQPVSGGSGEIQLAPEELGRTDYNPYVTRLLTLYSQASRTNTGTRGLDEIARLTYVDTALDNRLAPVITTGRYRLVIVTGNAGDGKTAFLQRVEALFIGSGAQITRLPSNNGSTWTWEGQTYATNYDGSQDEQDRSSDAVLDQFFSDFAGDPMGGLSGSRTALIAINEGRLLDFLAHGPRPDAFSGLRRFVETALQGGPGPTGALLINLNLRAVTAGGTNSLVERQLLQLLQPRLWEPCQACSVRDRCPLLHNAQTISDPNSGPAVRERIRRLLEVVHLRRRAHITMRDLRSALSWLLLRDHNCNDVHALLLRTEGDAHARLLALNYTEAFADPNMTAAIPASAIGERAVDRLVRRLREVDVGRVNSPRLDRELDGDLAHAVPWMTFELRSGAAWNRLSQLANKVPRPSDDVPPTTVIALRRRLAGTLRRVAYFERRDAGWRDMLPYRSVELLESVINDVGVNDRRGARVRLRDLVVEAISAAEGVRHPRLRREHLALAVSRVRSASVRSYRLFPKDAFTVEIRNPPAGEFIEFEPDAVELATTSGPARLRISLDLLEMLELIRDGYRPTQTDLQGLFVNFVIFRNELLASTFDRVLLCLDDENFFEVSAEADADGIRLSLEQRDLGAPTVVSAA